MAAKSHRIGVHLSVPEDKLKLFEKESYPSSSIITYWLHEGHAISWMSIVYAIESIGERGLAMNIRKKYCRVQEIGMCIRYSVHL